MKQIIFLFGALILTACGWQNKSVIIAQQNSNKQKQTIYAFTINSIEEIPISLAQFKGKALLIVNVASECGLTPQYKDLQTLYKRYKSKGLEVLGFPANNFLSQEPGSNKQIQKFCQLNYGVTFTMFSKISVKGEKKHPLYKYLTERKINGVLEAPVKWNFQKFLVDRAGRLVASIGPAKSVLDKDILILIKKVLKQQ